jgi:hypothetical protein
VAARIIEVRSAGWSGLDLLTLSSSHPPLNLIGKLNRRFSPRHTVAALSSSQWSLKLEVIYER